MPARSKGFLLAIVCISLLPVSCRTYGGYGSESAALDQIEAAHASFARDLERAKTDLQTLQGESQRDARVARLSAQMAEAVSLHERMLTEQDARLERARQKSGAYRFLSRTLRGTLAEQDMVYARYRDIAASLSAPVDTVSSPGSPLIGARYHVVPPFYERLATDAARRSTGRVSWALQGLDRDAEVAPGGGTEPGLQERPGEADVAPDQTAPPAPQR